LTINGKKRFIKNMNRCGIKILIVDDDEIIRDLLSKELLKLGVACCSARSTQEALEQISAQEFSLVISDLRMPGGNGDTLLNSQVFANQKIPLVFMTSLLDSQEKSLLSRGALGVIEKPLRMKDLAGLILRDFCTYNAEDPQVRV